MWYNKYNRRMFLTGAGKAMLPLPFLPSLLSKSAWAQTTNTTIKRFVGFYGGYDYGAHANWFPTLGVPNQSMTSSTYHRNINYQALSDFAPNGNSNLSNVFQSAFNPYLSKMNMYRGLDNGFRSAHSAGSIIGNHAAGANGSPIRGLQHRITIDQALRYNTTFNPGNLTSIHYGIDNNQRSWGRDSSDNIVRIGRTSNTVEGIYNILFRSGTHPESGAGTQDHPKKSKLDLVLADYNRTMQNRQISSADKLVLENFMDRVNDLTNNLTVSPTAACQYQSISRSTDGTSTTSVQTMRAYSQLVAAAMMCDIVRVGCFSYGFWEPIVSGQDFHQTVSHNPLGATNGITHHEHMASLVRNVAQNAIVPMLESLNSVVESNGKTMLDNSLVHFAPECAQVHSPNSTPCVTFGSADGALTTGWLMDYSDHSLRHEVFGSEGGWSHSVATNDPSFSNEYPGILYNRFFVTALQAMGLQPSDYENPAGLNSYFEGVTSGEYGAQNNNISNIGGFGYLAPPPEIVNGTPDGNDLRRLRDRLKYYNLANMSQRLPLPPVSA